MRDSQDLAISRQFHTAWYGTKVQLLYLFLVIYVPHSEKGRNLLLSDFVSVPIHINWSQNLNWELGPKFNVPSLLTLN